MSGLGKNQDTVFEALEKGNFFAPPGEDKRDFEDISVLTRSVEMLTPGLILGTLVPYLGQGWELLAFLGGILAFVGCLRLKEENRWCAVAVWVALVPVLGWCLRLFAQTLVPMLLESVVYPICLYAAVIGAAALPLLLTIGFLRIQRKAALRMGIAAVAAVVLPVLWALGVMIAIRIAVATLGAGALLWLLVSAKQENAE